MLNINAARPVAIGTPVAVVGSSYLIDSPPTYAGPDPACVGRRTGVAISYGVTKTATTEAINVAPAAEITINVKHPRITATKDSGRSYAPWLGRIDGKPVGTGKTKREAIADAAVTVAIEEWHLSDLSDTARTLVLDGMDRDDAIAAADLIGTPATTDATAAAAETPATNTPVPNSVRPELKTLEVRATFYVYEQPTGAVLYGNSIFIATASDAFAEYLRAAGGTGTYVRHALTVGIERTGDTVPVIGAMIDGSTLTRTVAATGTVPAPVTILSGKTVEADATLIYFTDKDRRVSALNPEFVPAVLTTAAVLECDARGNLHVLRDADGTFVAAAAGVRIADCHDTHDGDLPAALTATTAGTALAEAIDTYLQAEGDERVTAAAALDRVRPTAPATYPATTGGPATTGAPVTDRAADYVARLICTGKAAFATALIDYRRGATTIAPVRPDTEWADAVERKVARYQPTAELIAA